MNFTPEQLTKAKAAKSAEELIALAKENGIELTEEEAAKYFADLHKEGELADEELENVSGGSFCSNGSTYSSDPPYNLIVTAANRCSLYWEADADSSIDPSGIKGTCWRCRNAYYDQPITYCRRRTYGNDPLNK